MNIDEMQPGRPLDKLVAERVMGWRKISHLYCGYPPEGPRAGIEEEVEYTWPARMGTSLVPNYSTDIAVAWQVVEKLASLGITFAMGNGFQRDEQLVWVFSILQGPGKAGIITDAPNMPLAICRAALEAVLVTA